MTFFFYDKIVLVISVEKLEYRLYKKIEELFHPSISRSNISNYKIILDDNLMPIGVFYPNKEISLDHIIIFITDGDKDFCKDLAVHTNCLVFSLQVKSKYSFTKYYEVVKYLYQHIKQIVSNANITLMSDVNNTNLLEKVVVKGKKTNEFLVDKEICLRMDGAVEMTKNRLFIPSIQYDYTLYSKYQVFEIINKFVL